LWYEPARTAAPIYANRVAGLSEATPISGGAVHMAGAMGRFHAINPPYEAVNQSQASS
jgi:hypothetical protein